MLKSIKHLLEHNALLIAIALTLLIALLSLLAISAYVPDLKLTFQDKIEHSIAYFSLGLSWLLVHAKYLQKKISRYIIALGVIFYGIIIEVLQGSITSYRTFDYLDITANTIGVFLALLLFDRFNSAIRE